MHRRRLVMVVDDDLYFRQDALVVLGSLGYDGVAVHDTDDALSWLQRDFHEREFVAFRRGRMPSVMMIDIIPCGEDRHARRARRFWSELHNNPKLASIVPLLVSKVALRTEDFGATGVVALIPPIDSALMAVALERCLA